MLSATAPKWLYRQLQEADIIHVEHPWQFQWVYQNAPKNKPIVLGAQNVEAELYTRETMYAPSTITMRALKAIQAQEEFAVKRASVIAAASSDDANRLGQQHNISRKRFIWGQMVWIAISIRPLINKRVNTKNKSWGIAITQQSYFLVLLIDQT